MRWLPSWPARRMASSTTSSSDRPLEPGASRYAASGTEMCHARLIPPRRRYPSCLRHRAVPLLASRASHPRDGRHRDAPLAPHAVTPWFPTAEVNPTKSLPSVIRPRALAGRLVLHTADRSRGAPPPPVPPCPPEDPSPPVVNLWQRRHWVRGQGRLPGDWPVTPAPWPDTAEPAPQRSGRGDLRAHEGDPRGASL